MYVSDKVGTLRDKDLCASKRIGFGPKGKSLISLSSYALPFSSFSI